MAERLSSLAHIPIGAATGGVTLSEVPYGSLLQVRAWPDTFHTVQAVVVSEVPTEGTPALGTAKAGGGVVVAAVAPGRFMVAGPADLARRLETSVSLSDAAVTDISQGRVVLALEGEAAASVLSKCVMLDFDLTVFPPGRAAETAIHHIDVLIHRQSETRFELWVLRSFAQALAEWLLDAGLEEGIAFVRENNAV